MSLRRKFLYFLSFLNYVRQRFVEDRCMQSAASLAYTTLLSLVALVTIALTLITAFPVFSDVMNQLKIFILANMVPEAATRLITVYMYQFSNQAAKLTAIGVVFLIITALALILTIDRAFNIIWRVKKHRAYLHRFLVYWAVLTVGPLLIGASLSVTSYLLSLSFGLINAAPTTGFNLLKLVPAILTTLAFSLLYYTVPYRYVPARYALIGGAVAGICFEIMKKLFGFYVTNVATYTLIYGAFASFPIFLLWVYACWLVILLGAVIAASLSYWKSGLWQIEPTPGRRFYDSLRILGVLYHAQKAGQPISIQELRKRTRLPFEHIEEILDRLGDANYTTKVGANKWVLSRDADHIRIADIYLNFVSRLPATALENDQKEDEDSDSVLDTLLVDLATKMDQAMNMSLKTLYQSAKA